MNKIFFTSDCHFGHDKEFIWGSRGFNSIEEHDEALVERWNAVVDNEDIVYMLGDFALGGPEQVDKVITYINRLNFKTLYWVFGNHDSHMKIDKILAGDNRIINLGYGWAKKFGKKPFLLSHYPTITSNNETDLNACVINLYGHTHQKDSNFYNDCPYMYHVGMDSHSCTPIEISQIKQDIFNKINSIKSTKEN